MNRKKEKRDIEKQYTPSQFAMKLRRLAEAIESGKPFRIQVAGERLVIPPEAKISIEHERNGNQEEVEFQLTWKRDL